MSVSTAAMEETSVITEKRRKASDTVRFEILKETCEFRFRIENFKVCKLYGDDGMPEEFDSAPFTSGGSSDGIEPIQWRVSVKLQHDFKVDVPDQTFVICDLKKVSETKINYYEEKRITFHLVKSNGDLEDFKVEDHYYFYEYDKILNDEESFLPNGTLTVQCDLSITFPVTLKPLGTNLDCIVESPNLCQSVLRDMYESQLYTDLTIKCGDKEFKAHKCVLVTRSPVFREMFEHEGENVVEIEDATPEAIRAMLQFVYCSETDDVTQETRIQLYYLAEKYDLKELRKLCSQSIANQLRAKNVCEVALLAHLHHDDELLSATKEFFKSNSPDIVTSPDWISLISQHAELAKELVQK